MRSKSIRHHHIALSIVALAGTIVAWSAIVQDSAGAAYRDYLCTATVTPLTGPAPHTITVTATGATSGLLFPLVRWGNGTFQQWPNLTGWTSYTYTTPGTYNVSVWTNGETVCRKVVTVTDPTEGWDDEDSKNRNDDRSGDGTLPYSEGSDIACKLMVTPPIGLAPLAVKAMGAATFGATFTVIHWGDGTMTNNPALNTGVSHIYTQPGIYQVAGIVANGNLADVKTKRAKCSFIVDVKLPPSRGETNTGSHVNTWTRTTGDVGATGTTVIFTGIYDRPATGKNHTDPRITGTVVVTDKELIKPTIRPTAIAPKQSEAEIKEYRTEYNYVTRFLDKTLSITEKEAIENIISTFISEWKATRVAYQEVITAGTEFPKALWMTQTATAITNYKEALNPYVDATKASAFEKFILGRTNLMNSIYDKLEVIRKVKLQQQRFGK